ncbi:hypothetical protein [Persicitalea jodogahamensis]|uniref:Uncharacterized protein n=1 Tax=Persicitalea jodogahamensis TaxID=402147 RepID=A0A8J3D5V1_9BACT|nr:hypothetical protein [Persicitalea jodogahamensis]GHB64252.1 hypothetical protein GCM10007390_17670 [Persicitalea jodogahamensis]
MKKSVEFRLDGVPLYLAPRTGFVLERYNPLFDFGQVRGSKVYRFTVPYCPVNNRLFQYAADPQAVARPRKYFTEQYADGDLVERGFTFLQGVKPEGYEISFGSSFGDFFGDLRDVPLNLIPFGSEALPADHKDIVPEKVVAGRTVYTLPTILNAQFYGTTPPSGFSGRMNDYILADGYLATAPRVPMLNLHWVLRRLGEIVGCTFQGEFMDDPAAQRLLIYNTFALDGSTVLEYRNHLPADLTPRSLLLALTLPPFGISAFYDVHRRTITLRYSESGLATPTRLNLTDRTQPNLAPGTVIDRRLELDWELDSDDGLMKTTPAAVAKYTAPATDDSTLFPLKGKFSTLLMDGATGLPITEQVGISPINGQLDKKFKPRLLYWEGVVGGVPRASTAYGNQSLSFVGPNNLRDTFWKRYDSFRLRTFPVQLSVALTAGQLARLDFHRRAGEEVAVHVRGLDYYLSGLKAPLPLGGYCTLDAWRR